jgi:hypothetical protein
MANDQKTREDVKEALSAKKKAIAAFFFGTVVIAILFIFVKKGSTDTAAHPANQDSFQGPSELSATVQINCQESAKKIFQEKNCSDKEAEYLKNAPNCLNVYYSIDNETSTTMPEGNYGDIALDIAECYATVDQSKSKAADWLKTINESQDWDIYMGPITCDSKSTLASYIESYSAESNFSCLKSAELPKLISDLKAKNFKLLMSMVGPDEVPHQGIIEADVSCPETKVNIQKNLAQILSKPFEITEPKLESGAPDDIFLEFVRNNNRIINLQFKVKSDGCLRFQSLLAPSTETE